MRSGSGALSTWGTNLLETQIVLGASQNVPKHEKKIGQNVPIKRPHFSMEIFRRNMGFQQRKGLLKCLVLMYESLKWCFDGVFYVHAALDQR